MLSQAGLSRPVGFDLDGRRITNAVAPHDDMSERHAELEEAQNHNAGDPYELEGQSFAGSIASDSQCSAAVAGPTTAIFEEIGKAMRREVCRYGGVTAADGKAVAVSAYRKYR